MFTIMYASLYRNKSFCTNFNVLESPRKDFRTHVCCISPSPSIVYNLACGIVTLLEAELDEDSRILGFETSMYQRIGINDEIFRFAGGEQLLVTFW